MKLIVGKVNLGLIQTGTLDLSKLTVWIPPQHVPPEVQQAQTADSKPQKVDARVSTSPLRALLCRLQAKFTETIAKFRRYR